MRSSQAGTPLAHLAPMLEGTPFLPGSIPGDAEGSVAQVTIESTRARATSRDRRRQGRDRRGAGLAPPAGGAAARPTLPGVAAACAAGVIAAIFWCALLAFVGFELRAGLGDAGAFLVVLGDPALPRRLPRSRCMRARSPIRTAHSRKGFLTDRAQDAPRGASARLTSRHGTRRGRLRARKEALRGVAGHRAARSYRPGPRSLARLQGCRAGQTPNGTDSAQDFGGCPKSHSGC